MTENKKRKNTLDWLRILERKHGKDKGQQICGMVGIISLDNKKLDENSVKEFADLMENGTDTELMHWWFEHGEMSVMDDGFDTFKQNYKDLTFSKEREWRKWRTTFIFVLAMLSLAIPMMAFSLITAFLKGNFWTIVYQILATLFLTAIWAYDWYRFGKLLSERPHPTSAKDFKYDEQADGKESK